LAPRVAATMAPPGEARLCASMPCSMLYRSQAAGRGEMTQSTPAPPEYPISTRLPAPPAHRPRVLVTGATGYIASQLLPAFRQRYDLVLLDVRTIDGQGRPVPGALVADLLGENWADARSHFSGCDAVVHLAYYRPPGMSVTG